MVFSKSVKTKMLDAHDVARIKIKAANLVYMKCDLDELFQNTDKVKITYSRKKLILLVFTIADRK